MDKHEKPVNALQNACFEVYTVCKPENAFVAWDLLDLPHLHLRSIKRGEKNKNEITNSRRNSKIFKY